MGTLYECLKEARLEKYYPTFRANGITRSDSLAKLTSDQCSAMGVTSLDDKRRLEELIDIIRSVHGAARYKPSPSRLARSASARSASEHSQSIRRSSAETLREGPNMGVRGLEITRDVTVRDRTPNFSANSYMDVIELLAETSSEEESSDDSLSDDEPIVRLPGRTPETPKQGRNPLERVKHNSGYNYGVPKSKIVKRNKSSSRHSSDDRIRVCVRKRPLTKRETRASDEDIVVAESTTTLTVNEPKLAVDLKPYTLQHEFLFDEVFDETCTNEDVYVRATRPLISCLFDGGSATCFAYGQTGAGKTHTMIGNAQNPGLYLLAANDIFSLIQSGKYGCRLHVWVSFFEIYCGQLFDLLNKRNRLHPREDGSHRVCIAGLTETEAVDAKVLVEVLDYGNSVRSKGATGVNPDSSRSHAILQMEIRDDDDQRRGRISFIDLAGSERAADVTDTDKQTRLEGAEINQSLLALKECIRSIDQDSRHTPFRQSKLTHILKDSFVGNSKTCMIANISPTQSACENTLNTLRYADRVKELRRDSKNTNISQTMNLLMNIPITTPSVFNPGNVLASSTPMKTNMTRHTSQRHSDFHADPSETPIRSHGSQRKSVKGQSTKHKLPASPSRNHGNRSSSSAPRLVDIPRKMKESSRYSPSPKQALAGASASYSVSTTVQPGASASASHALNLVAPVKTEASASESDQTDTDSTSNNLTLPKGNEGLTSNIPLVHSADTELDFPTSDFNNVEQLNDLNKKGENYVLNPYAPAAQAWGPFDDHELKPSSYQLNERFRNANPTQQQDSYRGMQSTGFTATATDDPDVFGPGYFSEAMQVRQKTAKGGSPTRTRSSSRKHEKKPGRTASVDIVSDEQLFGEAGHGMGQESLNLPQPYVWGSSLESHTNQTNDPQTPRNGTMNQLSKIPAVMPADSSDLTTFSQRSPLKPDIKIRPKPQRKDGASSPKSGSLSPKSRTPPPSPKSKTPPLSPKSREAPPKSPKLRVRKADSLPPTSPVPKSPSHSDDSSDGVRASHSDQGQGPYVRLQNTSGSLRKEKSDPILALHLQNKKQTTPNPADFVKYLSRSGATRSNPSPTPLSTASGGKKTEESTIRELNFDTRRTRSDESLSSSGVTNTNHGARISKSQTSNVPSGSDARSSPVLKEILDAELNNSQTEVLKLYTSDENSSNKVSETQKFTVSSMFSPIHPQPITTAAVSQSVTTVPEDVCQPKPVSSTRPWESVTLNRLTQAADSRETLIAAHEDQLTRVTSLCKQEMKLLLTAKKSGQKGFEDYLRRLYGLLDQKMSTVKKLQDNIKEYMKKSGQNI